VRSAKPTPNSAAAPLSRKPRSTSAANCGEVPSISIPASSPTTVSIVAVNR
jgi:hypothetical protein